ncbi:hypothetical protein HYS31_02245 [Candidatus Woesearchaeota archaeon]|nr:hypothetical protein [Candidatus Woesearchaeota archaeon]
MNDPRSKLNVLRKGLETGAINELEYRREAEKLEQSVAESDKMDLNASKPDDNPNDDKPGKSSEKALIIGITALILLLAAVFAFAILQKPEPKTLEDLHVLNLKGKLKPEQGYVYKGAYSFVALDNQWYTQLQSPKGTKIYSMALRYSPRDLNNISIEGTLDKEFFDSQSEFYVTFNPVGNDFSHVSLAVADFGTHMSKVFEKNPIAACDRNETEPCKARPIVICEDYDKLVLYVREAPRQRVYYSSNCIVVEGSGLDLVKGVDRVLYNLYGIMQQEEQ